MDYFTPEPGQRMTRIANAAPTWRRDIDEIGFTHALVESRWPIAAVLEQDGWKRLWPDEHNVLLARP